MIKAEAGAEGHQSEVENSPRVIKCVVYGERWGFKVGVFIFESPGLFSRYNFPLQEIVVPGEDTIFTSFEWVEAQKDGDTVVICFM